MVTLTKTPPSDDDEDEWFRQFVLPEEYVIRHYPHLRGGSYRRFTSENVVDLVREQQRRAKHKGDSEAA
jgi:hypothetical protein